MPVFLLLKHVLKIVSWPLSIGQACIGYDCITRYQGRRWSFRKGKTDVHECK